MLASLTASLRGTASPAVAAAVRRATGYHTSTVARGLEELIVEAPKEGEPTVRAGTEPGRIPCVVGSTACALGVRPFALSSLCRYHMRTGRAWEASELRQKSWDDLHALWFVLLKERNRLHATRLMHQQAKTTMREPSRYKKVGGEGRGVRCIHAGRLACVGRNQDGSGQALRVMALGSAGLSHCSA